MKQIMATALLLSFSVFIHAADYDGGGQVENISQYSTEDDQTWTQANKILFWGRAEFSPQIRLYAKGGYLYRYEEEEHVHIPDFTALYLYGNSSVIEGTGMDYRVGRFRISDPSRKILSSVADGFRLSFPGSTIPLNLAVGYSGLVFLDNSEILMTPADEYESEDGDGLLAPPRLIASLDSRYSELPGGAALFFSVVAQQDLRTEDFIEKHAEGSGQFHTQYALLGLDGRITPELYFSASGALQTGQYVIPEPSDTLISLAGLGRGSLEYYIDSPLAPVISLEVLYATGDSWGDRADWIGGTLGDTDRLYRFSPVSNSSKGFVYSLQIGNLLYGDLSFSLKPLDTLQLSLNGTTFFRAVDGPVSDGDIEEASGSDLYIGQEIDFIINWRPYSDFGLSLTSGVFLPNTEIFEEDDPRFRIGGYFSFSF